MFAPGGFCRFSTLKRDNSYVARKCPVMRCIQTVVTILPYPEKCDTSELEKIWEYTLPECVREGRTNKVCAKCTKLLCIFVHFTIDNHSKICYNLIALRTAETLNENSVDRIQAERLVFMNVKQFRPYILALVCEYNLWAGRVENKASIANTKRFDKAKSELLGAVTAAKMLGVDVKITYTEPTYYYSTLSLVSVQ